MPRVGHAFDGVCNVWNGLMEGKRIDATDIAFMTNIIPSMSDTLMHNDDLYNSHAYIHKAREWADGNPGVTAVLTNSMDKLMSLSIFNSTITLDMSFK